VEGLRDGTAGLGLNAPKPPEGVDPETIGPRVDDRRRCVHDFGQVRHAARLSQTALVAQPPGHLHGVDWLTGFGERERGFEHPPVRLGVQVLRAQKVRHVW
jgi:hypothetical protein